MVFAMAPVEFSFFHSLLFNRFTLHMSIASSCTNGTYKIHGNRSISRCYKIKAVLSIIQLSALIQSEVGCVNERRPPFVGRKGNGTPYVVEGCMAST